MFKFREFAYYSCIETDYHFTIEQKDDFAIKCKFLRLLFGGKGYFTYFCRQFLLTTGADIAKPYDVHTFKTKY